MEIGKPVEQALQECEDKIKELEEENQHLRESSHAFGQLAERLNRTLLQERRMGLERRHAPRPNPDRRNLTVHLPHESTNDRKDG
jgi:hypothetical protein